LMNGGEVPARATWLLPPRMRVMDFFDYNSDTELQVSDNIFIEQCNLPTLMSSQIHVTEETLIRTPSDITNIQRLYTQTVHTIPNIPIPPRSSQNNTECIIIPQYHGNNSKPKTNVNLNILAHNINGMRGNDQKFKMLKEYCTS